VEEVDETHYWLEIISITNLSVEKEELNRLTDMAKAKESSYKSKN